MLKFLFLNFDLGSNSGHTLVGHSGKHYGGPSRWSLTYLAQAIPTEFKTERDYVLALKDIALCYSLYGRKWVPVPELPESSETSLETARGHIRNQVAIQGSNGNWNCNSYMHGMFNGLECALATIEGREPQYKDAPDQWLDDRIPKDYQPTVAGSGVADPSIQTFELPTETVGEVEPEKVKSAELVTAQTPFKSLVKHAKELGVDISECKSNAERAALINAANQQKGLALA